MLPRKQHFVLSVRVEYTVQDFQAFDTVQHLRRYAKRLEVAYDVGFYAFQP